MTITKRLLWRGGCSLMLLAVCLWACGADPNQLDAGNLPDVGLDTGSTVDVRPLDVATDSGIEDSAGGSSDSETDIADAPEMNDVAGDEGGAVGTPCLDDLDCASGDCVDLGVGDVPGLCSELCGLDVDCPDGFECTLVASSGSDAERRCLPVDYCADGDGDQFGVGPGCLGIDCYDGDETINLAADEICDGIDNDCDGSIDEYSIDVGGDCTTGFPGVCALGRTSCVAGSVVCVAMSGAADERCDGLDNDCDGSVDEDVLIEGFRLVDGVCVPVDCGAVPAAPANATLIAVSSTQFGGVISWTCNEGYSATGFATAEGFVTATCSAFGEWLAPTGVCVPVDCGSVPEPSPNARLQSVERTTLGGTATYACNEGYRSAVDSGAGYTVVCDADGAWSAAADCDPVNCGTLTNPTYGRVATPTGLEYNDVATYTCDSGYLLSAGSSTRICDAAGLWSGSAAVCSPVSCGPLLDPANGSVSLPDGSSYGATANYRCDDGYELSGPMSRTCGASGNWSGSAPTCASTSCGSVASVPNASVEVPSSTLGSVATFTCATGYLQQEGTAASQICDGTAWSWLGAPLVCDPVNCGPLGDPANGAVVTPSGLTYSATATYSCADGYLLVGAATRTCSEFGSWSGSAPICAAVDCGTPPAVANGTRSFTETSLGSTANYTCAGGYALTGTDTLTCAASASWGTAPICEDTNECVLGGVCTATGNVCANTPGSWECSCMPEYRGATVTGRNALCTPSSTLGIGCTVDSDCSAGEWCPTNTTLRFCSPRPILPGALMMPFQYVPAGTYMMGSPAGELGRETDEDQVSVTITRNYFVGRTEVTQAQWKALSGGVNPSCFQWPTGWQCSSSDRNDSGPVENVSWYSVLGYANALSAHERLPECYALTGCSDPTNGWVDGIHSGCSGATFVGPSCTGYRLATEAEWERAARAGTLTATYNGNLRATNCADTTLLPIAWTACNASSRAHTVGGKLPNAWGLYDMLGNVMEWTWDWYVSPLPGGTDPVGPVSGTLRPLRGGNWYIGPGSSRAAARMSGFAPDSHGFDVGFRLARSAP